MKPPPDIPELERSGFAIVLGEQPEEAPGYPVLYEPAAIELNVSELITISSPEPPGLWRFLYVTDEGQYEWLSSALGKLGRLASGTDKAYAELALRQASHVSESEPRICNAPEGGVVIESRTESGMLSLLIEERIGLIVRSADDFHVRAEFDITPDSINELLARYVYELTLHIETSGG